MPPQLPRSNPPRSNPSRPNPSHAHNSPASAARPDQSPNTLGALQNMASSRVDSRLAVVRSQLFFRIFRYVPYPVIVVLPFIRQDFKQLIQAWQQNQSTPSDAPEPAKSSPLDTERYPEQSSFDPRLTVHQPSPYPRYRCDEHPLACSHLQHSPPKTSGKSSRTKTSQCQHCGFPGLLAENSELRGQRGRYQVGQFLGSRGAGRLYTGRDITRQQPVVIREYLLPSEYFNAEEQRLNARTFESIGGLNLADGRQQDFRIVEPWDVMGDRQAPERCYLITQGDVDTYPTLRSTLAQQGAFGSVQVRAVLNQVLQTLESLHGQKYVLPAGQLQAGLAHGNLTLDSIVMLPEANTYYEQPQLLIFLRDLALWESLFSPSAVATQIPQPIDDLAALGQVALALLVGSDTDEQGRPLRPRSPQVWPGIDLPLEQFLRQLLTLEEPTFTSATEARQALLRLPLPPVLSSPTSDPETVSADGTEPWRMRPWVWLILLGLFGLLGASALGWWLSRRRAIASPAPTLCCVADVPAVPPGEFRYATARQGIWYPLWHSKNLVARGQTLEQYLEAQQPDLDLKLMPFANHQLAIEQVNQDEIDFAIAPLPNGRPPDLTVAPIAYDGLAVFVAFSYVERDQGLPQRLDGQISLDQLRRLYTGEILNWRELGGPDLPVKLYLPNQPELIQIFEARVLQTPESIQTFRQQWGLPASPEADAIADQLESFTVPSDSDTVMKEVLSPLEMLRHILQDFEASSQVGGIGFASLSQIYGQCSVYPLAIATPDNPAIQPLYQRDRTPISPTVDLCADKGNYAPNQSFFTEKTYPLAYPLAVFYRRDNSRLPIAPTFVQMMTTDEGQRLLMQTGLVPLE